GDHRQRGIHTGGVQYSHEHRHAHHGQHPPPPGQHRGFTLLQSHQDASMTHSFEARALRRGLDIEVDTCRGADSSVPAEMPPNSRAPAGSATGYSGCRAAVSLAIALAADWLAVGPRAARLAISAAVSGRSSVIGPRGTDRSIAAPPARPAPTGA